MPDVKSIDGTNIFYEVIGKGEISLIFIGGLGAPTGKDCWKYQLELAKDYKLVLIDLAGHGKSGRNRDQYTVELYGQDVRAVVEKLDLNKIILIGWSLGGAVILESEILLSDRILGLIPVDSLYQNSLTTKMDDKTSKMIIEPYEENFVEAFDNLLDSFISDKFDSKQVEFLHSLTPSLDERSIISALFELCRWDMHDILSNIKKPIKSIIAGRTMEHYSKEEYEKYIDAVYLDGLGHLLPYEDPKTFNEVLIRVIKEFT